MRKLMLALFLFLPQWAISQGIIYPATLGTPTFDVRAYGAKCDGSTDDATALQSALSTAAFTGGIVQLPVGVCISGTTLTVNSGVRIQGAGQFISILKARISLTNTSAVLSTFNNGGAGCLLGTYTNCPVEFGFSDFTIDGNVAQRTAAASGCALDIRGNRYYIIRVDIINAPFDGACSEMVGGASTPPYFGQSNTSYGNASYWERVRPNHNTNRGLLFNGPPDSWFYSIVPFLNTDAGAVFGCVSSGTVCGANSYLSNFHAWNNGSWGLRIQTPVQGNNIQSETAQANGGIIVEATACASGNNCGELQATQVQTWNNTGVGLELDSPPATYTTFPQGNIIAGLQSFSNTSNGLTVAATAANQTHITGEAVLSNGVGVNYAPSGGKLLCALDNAGAITGNGAVQTMFSCTVPAYFTNAGHVIVITALFSHGTGTGSVTYDYTWNGTSTAVSYSTTQTGGLIQTSRIKITAVNTLVHYADTLQSGALPGLIASTTFQGSSTFTSTTNTDGVLLFRMNAAGTEAVTPREFLVIGY